MRTLARNHQCCFRSGLSSHVSSSTRPPTELGRSTERQTQMRCIEECAYLLLPPNIENGGLGAVLLRTISPIPHQVTTWQTSRGWLRTVAPGVGMVGWPGLERGEKESKPEGQGPPAARGRAAGVALETVRNPISTILSSSLATLGLDLRGRTIGAVDIEPLSTPTTAYSHLELPSALVENVLIPAPICNVAERTPRSAKSHE